MNRRIGNFFRGLTNITLIEWLVIISICAILAAMILPAVSRTHHRQRQDTVYRVGDTVTIERNGEILRGRLVTPER